MFNAGLSGAQLALLTRQLATLLKAGLPVDEAVGLGAQCGAAILTGRGAYEHQLASTDVDAD